MLHHSFQKTSERLATQLDIVNLGEGQAHLATGKELYVQLEKWVVIELKWVYEQVVLMYLPAA